jgi:pyruvate dehydrogenase E2 component (dihydrolipoamide acetyltransferase)
MNVLMPQLGETVAEGTVARWYKQVGDKVNADDVLFDVETDKASMEVPAQTAGVLTQILVPEGSTVDVGTVLAVIDTGDGAKAEASGQAGRGQGARGQAPISAEETQVSRGQAPISKSAAQPSTTARKSVPDPSSSPDSSSPSWYAAMPPAILGEESSRPEKPVDHRAPTNGGTVTPSAVERKDHQRLSPAVRRLAAEYRLDLATVAGSGRNGRITRRNVIDFIAVRDSQPQEAPAPVEQESAPVPTPAAALAQPAPAIASGDTLPFTRIRRLTAEHMVRSKATSPHVLQAVEVDFHRVDQVRKSVREAWKAKHGYSLTYLPFIAHAVCEALREFPNANASVQGDGLVLHADVNLGIAIDLGPEGLVAPVIKAAQKLSVAELSITINDLALRARANKLKPDDFSGGTFTLTNNGTFGTLITAPIINQPQVAIISTDGVRKKPVVIEGPDGDSIAIRPVGILAQSFDHRAIDGAYSAAFLDRVRKLLENGNWVIEV